MKRHNIALLAAAILIIITLSSCNLRKLLGSTDKDYLLIDVATFSVLGSVPTSGEYSVPVQNDITLTLSKNVENSSINNSTFSITDAFNNSVGGSAAAGSTITFSPDSHLLYNLPYTVTATTGIMDTGGNNLTSEFSSSFRTQIKPVSGGHWHALAIDSSQNVLGWGSDWLGELGTGSTDGNEVSVPGYVIGAGSTGILSDVDSVAGGNSFSLAVLSDGTVYAWGYNYYGQLGNEEAGSQSDVPVQVAGPGGSGVLENIIAVSANFTNSYALKSDGTVWAWGDGDDYYGIGDGTEIDRTTPVQVKTGSGASDFLENIVAISGGSYQALALKADGTVWAWGSNWYGELGNGTEVEQLYAVQVSDLTDIVAIDAGLYCSAAIRSDGTLWTWGSNENGELGINIEPGVQADSSVPVQVVGPGGTGYLDEIVSVDAGYEFMTACRSDGTVWTWGDNDLGQLGNNTVGSTLESLFPVQVVSEDGAGYLTGAVAVSATCSTGFALLDDGTLYGWGSNDDSNLAAVTTEVNGSDDPISSRPIRVGNLDLF
jgi:alpha-tubulin suppressor-like RCC1 family protein